MWIATPLRGSRWRRSERRQRPIHRRLRHPHHRKTQNPTQATTPISPAPPIPASSTASNRPKNDADDETGSGRS